MSARGRPPNLRAWADLLDRLGRMSLGEVVRTGPYTRDQVRSHVREFVRNGFIRAAPAFSYLDSDGFGGKRYVLTAAGKAAQLEAQTRSGPPVVIIPQQGGSKFPVSGSEIASDRVSHPSPGPRFTQHYVGVHNVAYSMVVTEPFRVPFEWDPNREYPMGPKGSPRWLKRHGDLDKRTHIEESGGRMGDEAGAASHTITVKFRVDGTDPLAVEREAEGRIEGIRRTLELRYQCALSDPVPKGIRKHSAAGDPWARFVTGTGARVAPSQGQPGVDDTPEPGTLEFATAEEAKAYVDALLAIGKGLTGMDAKLDLLIAGGTEQSKAIAGLTEALNRLLDKLTPKGPDVGPAAPKPSDGAGYG